MTAPGAALLPPLRLPPGWTAVPVAGGALAAAGPEHLGLEDEDSLSARPLVSTARWAEADPADLVSAAGGMVAVIAQDARELQLLDEQPATLADGRAAHRAMLACLDAVDVPRTVEVWVAADPDGGCTVLTASTPTPMWPLLGDRLRRALRSAGGTAPDRDPARERAEAEPAWLPVPGDADMQVRVGEARSTLQRRQGRVSGELPEEVVATDLPLALLPHWLSAAHGLGPRPVPAVEGLMLADAPDLDALAGGDDGPLVDGLTGPWVGALRALAAAGPRRLAVAGPGGEVDLLDGGDAGLWATWRDGPQAGLRPLSPTEAWSALVAACCS